MRFFDSHKFFGNFFPFIFSLHEESYGKSTHYTFLPASALRTCLCPRNALRPNDDRQGDHNGLMRPRESVVHTFGYDLNRSTYLDIFFQLKNLVIVQAHTSHAGTGTDGFGLIGTVDAD